MGVNLNNISLYIIVEYIALSVGKVSKENALPDIAFEFSLATSWRFHPDTHPKVFDAEKSSLVPVVSSMGDLDCVCPGKPFLILHLTSLCAYEVSTNN